MTNIVADGFNTYPINSGPPAVAFNALDGSQWNVNATSETTNAYRVDTVGGRRAFGAASNSALANPYNIYAILPDDNIYCFGAAIYSGGWHNGSVTNCISLYGATSRLWLGVNATGNIILRRGTNNSATYLYTGSTQLGTGVWHYLDCVYNRSAGTAEIYLNNTLVTTVTSIASIGIIQTGRVGANTNVANTSFTYWTDVIFNQGNDRFGMCSVVPLDNIADGVTDWTNNGASDGYEILNNVPPDTGEYIEAASPGDEGQYTVGPTPDVTWQILAVKHQYRGVKTTSADGDVTGGLVVNGTVYDGDNNSMAESTWNNFQDYYDLNPDTGQPWLPQDFAGGNVSLNYRRTA